MRDRSASTEAYFQTECLIVDEKNGEAIVGNWIWMCLCLSTNLPLHVVAQSSESKDTVESHWTSFKTNGSEDGQKVEIVRNTLL